MRENGLKKIKSSQAEIFLFEEIEQMEQVPPIGWQTVRKN